MTAGGSARYRIVETAQYRRDLRRLERAGRYDVARLDEIINALARGQVLPPRFRNHRLKGTLAECEECHISGDWLLMYRRKKEELILLLLRTGTHVQLFGE